jgi:hypothetical protein
MSNNFWVQPEELGDYAYTEFTEEAIRTASYLLWSMSGRKYTGETTVTERYTCTLRNNRIGPSTKTNSPVLFGGDVYNIPSGDYDEYSELTSDGMSPDSRIRLRGRPVTKIHSIRNRTGSIIDPSSYYLVEHSTVHIKAGTPWTPCNTEITYTYGTPIPAIGKMAARTMAIEFIKLWSDDDTCALPQRVTSVARQGVSYTILDQQEFIQELRTGIYVIDLFIKTVNPDGARRKSKVFSPDQPRARRYSPKSLVLTANTDYDLALIKDTPAAWSSTGLDELDLSNLFPNTGWTAVVTLRSYSGNKAVDLDSSSITVNQESDTISFTVPYDKALSALGMVDPGIWTLYATKTIDGVENIVELAAGNLQIKMYS